MSHAETALGLSPGAFPFESRFRDPARRTGTQVFPAEIVRSRNFLAGFAARLPDFASGRAGFVWPDGAVAFGKAELARWRTIYPAARVEMIPRCGHYLWEEAPHETTAAPERILAA